MTDTRKCTNSWLVVFACTALAALLRLYYVNVAVIDHPIRGDATAYYAYAWNVVHKGVFSHALPGDGLPTPDSYRDPGYPLLIALTMRLAGSAQWYQFLLNIQALLSSMTVFLVMLLGRRWMSWPWLAATGILLAAWPHSITSASYLLTETLCGFLVTAGIVLISTPAARRPAISLLTGGLLGAAALTNAVLLLFTPSIAAFLALLRFLPRNAALALLLGSLALPGIWAFRNGTLPSTASAVTSTSTGRAMQNLVQGSWPEYHDAWHGMLRGDSNSVDLIHKIDDEIATAIASPSKGLRSIAHRLSSSSWRYLRWYLSKPALLWDWSIRIGSGDFFIYPVSWSPYLTSTPFIAMATFAHALNPWAFLLAVAFCALTIARRSRRSSNWVPAACLLIYVTTIYCVLQSEPRYSIPFKPIQILAAMTTLATLAHSVSEIARKISGASEDSPALEHPYEANTTERTQRRSEPLA